MKRQPGFIYADLRLARVIDDDVDRSERAFDIFDQGRDLSRVRKFGGFCESFPGSAAEFLEALEDSLRRRRDGDLGARRPEQSCGCETDAKR